MNEREVVLNYLFYLQLKPELDPTYYLLSKMFSRINLQLVPISLEELKRVDRDKKIQLIVMRDDFPSAFLFNEMRKTYLDVAMASGRMVIYDMSSFSKIELAARLERKNAYRHFQLPLNIKQVAATIAVEFFRTRRSWQTWPGGRRAKLPSMPNG